MAYWLRDRRFEAYAVRGGIAALVDPDAVEEPVAEAPSDTVSAPGGLTALSQPLFRIYISGVVLSLIGSWAEAAAFGYVVLLLGGSAAALGVIGFLNTVPNLVFGLFAGALADRYDRRRLLFVFQALNASVSLALAVLWFTHSLSVALMGALAVVGGSLGTLCFPAFQGLLASTVPQSELASAVALNSIALQLARFVGPALAGFLLAAAGPGWVFGANAASFAAVLLSLVFLPSSRAVSKATARLGGAMREGLAYLLGQRSVQALLVLTLLAGLFGTPPVAFMLAAIVRFNLHAGAETLGVLTACIGLGSLGGSLALIGLSGRPNKGEPILLGFFLTALSVALVGLSHNSWLSYGLALAGGFFGVLFVGLSTVVVQSVSSDSVRARAMAIWAAAFVGVLPIGALVTAALAQAFGTGAAVAIDGAVMLVGGAVVIARRQELFWLGCAALPQACVAATDPAGLAYEQPAETSA